MYLGALFDMSLRDKIIKRTLDVQNNKREEDIQQIMDIIFNAVQQKENSAEIFLTEKQANWLRTEGFFVTPDYGRCMIYWS
jgi:hypothetical protein